MPKYKPNPKIAAALQARGFLLVTLQDLSPNVELLDDSPETLPHRLAETFRTVARVAHEAAEALEVDEGESDAG